MIQKKRSVVVLLADDDDDDWYLIEHAFRESKLLNPLYRVKDGVELLEYLRGEGEYADATRFPTPGLVLLDLNIPRKDGREALSEIRADAHLRHLAVVVLSTSKSEEDVIRSYQLGVNSFVAKPVTFQGLLDAIRLLGSYRHSRIRGRSPAQKASRGLAQKG